MTHALLASVPLGLHPDLWGGLCLLGLFALLVLARLGWLQRIPGAEDLVCGPEEENCSEP